MAVLNGKQKSSVGSLSSRHHRMRPPGRLDRQVEQDITIPFKEFYVQSRQAETMILRNL